MRILDTIAVRLGLTGRDKFVAEMRKTEKDTVKSFDKIKASAAGFTKQLTSLPGLLASIGVTMFIRDSVNKFKIQEQAVRGVQVAVEQQGASWDKLGKSILETASALQNVTTFGDEQTLQALTRAINSGADYQRVLENISLIQDIAAGTGSDLGTIAEYVGRAIQGQTEMLGRYVPSIRNLNAEQRTWSNIQAILIKQFGGMAEKMALTKTGQLEQYTNAWGDLKESVGELVLTLSGPAIKTALFNLQTLNALITEDDVDKRTQVKAKWYNWFLKLIAPITGQNWDDEIDKMYDDAIAKIKQREPEIQEAKGEVAQRRVSGNVNMKYGRLDWIWTDIAELNSKKLLQKELREIDEEEDAYQEELKQKALERWEEYQGRVELISTLMEYPMTRFFHSTVMGMDSLHSAWHRMLQQMLSNLIWFMTQQAVMRFIGMLAGPGYGGALKILDIATGNYRPEGYGGNGAGGWTPPGPSPTSAGWFNSSGIGGGNAAAPRIIVQIDGHDVAHRVVDVGRFDDRRSL